MKHRRGLIVVLLSVGIFSACSSVTSRDTIYQGTKRYPANPGTVAVYWKDQGVPVDLTGYDFVATVKARSTWCGLKQARFNSNVHSYLISRAGEVGGDTVVLYCGELGSVGECYCYGDVYRKK